MKNKLIITGSAREFNHNNLADLWHVTESKRIKADGLGRYLERDELNDTLYYLDIAIADEFNIEWNE